VTSLSRVHDDVTQIRHGGSLAKFQRSFQPELILRMRPGYTNRFVGQRQIIHCTPEFPVPLQK
jgi:hypothetical protein